MADIKLVIEIDEDIVHGIIDGENDVPRNIVRGFQVTIADAIKNGTPLPKGHRFIDADEILNHAFITEDFVQKYYCIKKEVMDKALVLFDTLEADKEQ